MTLISEVLAVVGKAVTTFSEGWKVRSKGKELTSQSPTSPRILLQLISSRHSRWLMAQPLCGRVHGLLSNPGSPLVPGRGKVLETTPTPNPESCEGTVTPDSPCCCLQSPKL